MSRSSLPAVVPVALLLLLVVPAGRPVGASFAPLTVTASATPPSGPFPLNVTLSANATGGWPPYTYQWSFGDGSPNGSSASVAHTYRWAATFAANVTVTDSVGEISTTSIAVEAHAAPLAVALSASPASVEVRNQTFLETSVQGGTSPFAYAWTGLPGGCPAQAVENLSCTPTEAGTFVVRVTVTDALGLEANATVVLLVTGPTAPPPAPSTPTSIDWTPVIVGAAALAVVVAVALGIWRVRRRRG